MLQPQSGLNRVGDAFGAVFGGLRERAAEAALGAASWTADRLRGAEARVQGFLDREAPGLTDAITAYPAKRHELTVEALRRLDPAAAREYETFVAGTEAFAGRAEDRLDAWADRVAERHGLSPEQKEDLVYLGGAGLGVFAWGVGRGHARSIDTPDGLQAPRDSGRIGPDVAGRRFDELRAPDFRINQLVIEPGNGSTKSGRAVLDSYEPGFEIVSRKHTQIGELANPDSFKGAIRELVTKYPQGARIADVPSKPNGAGDFLRGDHFLEVPVQRTPIPKSVLDEANRLDVTIRDHHGRVYN